MNAFHIISTAPFFAKNPNGAYFMDKTELYCAALSALSWRRNNGKITLATDRAGADFIEKIGISELWDEVAVNVADDLEGINPHMFWAAGKLLALREMPAPTVMLDTDFIVWNRLELPSNALVAAHREDLTPSVYPPPEVFRFKRRFELPQGFDSVLPLNTAFLRIPDESFKQYYLSRAISFMKSAADSEDFLCCMVFAEQRMLAICAEELGVPTATLLDKGELFFPQNSFTHLWGAKREMRQNPAALSDFCTRARARITAEYPKYAGIIGKIESSCFLK